MKNIELILFYLSLKLSISVNLISNNSFEEPVLPPSSYQIEGAIGWLGNYYDLLHYGNGIGFGQYIDMQRDIGQNGYLEQVIYLQDPSICTLTFYYYPYDTNFMSYRTEVYWNGVLIVTEIPTAVRATLETLVVFGNVGNNVLKFQETGDSSDSTGMYIDEVAL